MITEADLSKCRVVESDHYNGGEKFFGHGGRCVEQPRLYRLVKYWRADRSTTVEWLVDGEPVNDLREAAEKLNAAPSLGAAERAELATVPSEYTDIRQTMNRLLNHKIRSKGLVEWRDGKCRITDAGRTALASGAAR